VAIAAGSAVSEIETLDAFVEEVMDRLNHGDTGRVSGAYDPRRQERVEVVHMHYVRLEATNCIAQCHAVADRHNWAQREEQSLSDVELIDVVIGSFVDLYLDSGTAKESYLVANDSVDTGGSRSAMPIVYDEDAHGASIRRENLLQGPCRRDRVHPGRRDDAHPIPLR
jgi:hypothetical protein